MSFSQVGPTKVFVFTQKFLIVENEEHLFDFVIHVYFPSLCFNALPSNKVSLGFGNTLSSEKTPLNRLGSL